MNPGGSTCIVLHNLACAQWLHSRKFADTNAGSLSGELAEEFQKATVDFIECVPNFQRAVQLFEGFSEVYTVESGLNFKNKMSGLSLTNIAEVYLEELKPEVKEI